MENEEKEYFVDFGPELLKLLGPNLYTNIYYVLGEIIANAYDADANNVYIIYNTDNNSIIVEDDGDGMTYEEINSKFLPIGVSTRMDDRGIYTKSGRRKRMGRKGIGKLAALSVSNSVKITSKKNGVMAGCILSLDISQKNEGGRYKIPAIDENKIKFERIENSDNGTAIIMEESRYLLHKSINSAKRNISLIFPFTSKNFKIHLENKVTRKRTTIDSFVKEAIKLSDALITFSDESSKYNEYLTSLHVDFDKDRYYKDLKRKLSSDQLPEKKVLNLKEDPIIKKIQIENNHGETKDYNLIICGWISTYATTRDKKRDTDFHSNHISIIANEKLGQFDILPDITTDRMNESYVVGQFYVDLLEETELPDIASSNRQGYKEDDERFILTKQLIQKHALRPILELKKLATDEKNYLKRLEKENELKRSKEEYDKAINTITSNPKINSVVSNSEEIRNALEKSWTLKDVLKDSYKKVMISHASEDKKLIDELEKILHFVGFEKQEILYTSSKHIESGYGMAYVNIYEYLREFFINTTIRHDLCVIYILNKRYNEKWNTVLEAGAGWALRSTWYPMYTDEYNSVLSPFNTVDWMPYLGYDMNELQAKYLATAISKIATNAGKTSETGDTILHFIETSTKLIDYK